MSAYVSICKAIRQFWYPYGETAVSIHRNCRFLPWKRSFPTVETTISNTGNSSSPPGNWSLMHLINFRTHRKQVYVQIIQCGRYSICNASATGICNATTSCKLIYYTRFVAGGRYFYVFSTLQQANVVQASQSFILRNFAFLIKNLANSLPALAYVS